MNYDEIRKRADRLHNDSNTWATELEGLLASDVLALLDEIEVANKRWHLWEDRWQESQQEIFKINLQRVKLATENKLLRDVVNAAIKWDQFDSKWSEVVNALAALDAHDNAKKQSSKE